MQRSSSKINFSWMNLSFLEMMNIEDQIQKEYCLKMRKDCLKKVISPLLTNLPLHTGFKFSEGDLNLSCNAMLNELFIEYRKRNYSKEEIRDIIQGKRVRKR